MQQVLLPIADDSEELEAVSIIDVLRRAGIDVCIASVMADRKTICCAHQTSLEADALIEDVLDKDWDMIVLPGGMPGAKHLQECRPLIERLKQQRHDGGWVAAICASPAVVLAHHGLLAGNKACCYPGFEEALGEDAQVTQNAVEVVEAAKLITAQGPGAAIEFGLNIVKVLLSKQQASQVAQGLLVDF